MDELIHKSDGRAAVPQDKAVLKPLQPEALRLLILEKLAYTLGKDIVSAHPRDWFFATALAVRDFDCRLLDNVAASHR